MACDEELAERLRRILSSRRDLRARGVRGYDRCAPMRPLLVVFVVLAGSIIAACADGALPPRTVADPANPNAPESPFTPPKHVASNASETAPVAPGSASAGDAMPDMPGMKMP